MTLQVFTTGVWCSGLVIGICAGAAMAVAVMLNCKLRKLDKEPAEKILETWKRVTK